MDTQRDFHKTAAGSSELAERIGEIESEIKKVDQSIDKLKHQQISMEDEINKYKWLKNKL